MNTMELLKGLSNEMMFDFEQNKKIAHLRCQFGMKKQIANQFVTMKDFKENVAKFNIDLKRVQEVVNIMQFDWIVNYEILEDLCNNEETNFFYQDENVNYWIRLNPFGTSDYNMYIHIYHQ